MAYPARPLGRIYYREEGEMTDQELQAIRLRAALGAPEDIHELLTEVERLREALAVYADEGNWTEHGEYRYGELIEWHGEGRHGYELAQAALADQATGREEES